MNSLEGRRGEPRNKPPVPRARPCFGPDGYQHVENAVHVLPIVI